jgi:hypothetical protein
MGFSFSTIVSILPRYSQPLGDPRKTITRRKSNPKLMA